MAADEFRVEGADAMLQLGKRLKAAGRGDLLKEMNAANKAAVKPVTPATRKRALAILPKGGYKQEGKGGLNKVVAKAPQRTTSRVGGTTASVRVTVAGKKSGAYAANQGKVRHPVFRLSREKAKLLGDPRREMWTETKVKPGWFDDPIEDMKPQIRDDVTDVLVEFAEKLTRPL